MSNRRFAQLLSRFRNGSEPGPAPRPSAPAARLTEYPTSVAIPLLCGFIDWVDQAACLFRAAGWSTSNPLDEITLLVNGQPLEPLNCFRTYRADVAAHLGASDRFCGFGIEYLLPPGRALLALAVQEKTVYSTVTSVPADLASRYALGLRHALTRDQVYPTTYEVLKNGCPPPAPEPELLEFLTGCEGPILDFGCGAGLLIQELRSRGLAVQGLDLSEMAPFVVPEIRDHVTLYDGRYPAPIPSGTFATVVCAEVLEHIADYRPALEEMARLTRDRLIISVPDNALLQICQSHNLIPWHYLTGDHYSFFNQASLVGSLQTLFRSVEVIRTSMFRIDEVPIYANLLADCRK